MPTIKINMNLNNFDRKSIWIEWGIGSVLFCIVLSAYELIPFACVLFLFTHKKMPINERHGGDINNGKQKSRVKKCDVCGEPLGEFELENKMNVHDRCQFEDVATVKTMDELGDFQ